MGDRKGFSVTFDWRSVLRRIIHPGRSAIWMSQEALPEVVALLQQEGFTRVKDDHRSRRSSYSKLPVAAGVLHSSIGTAIDGADA